MRGPQYCEPHLAHLASRAHNREISTAHKQRRKVRHNAHDTANAIPPIGQQSEDPG
jgi:hypothetical protein